MAFVVYPDQTIIPLPDHTVTCLPRASGVVASSLVGFQESVPGLYRAPSFRYDPLLPPQMIISPPSQTALCSMRPDGVLGPVPVGVKAPPAGSKRHPVLGVRTFEPDCTYPPQRIISVPVQTAVCWYRASGAVLTVH